MEIRDFGHWLKTQRIAQGLVQRDVEEGAGISHSHYSRLENGKIGMPEAPTRNRIHKVLGTSDDDLVEAGLLKKERYGDRLVYIQDIDEAVGINEAAATYDADDLPAELRASFLLTKDWDPDKQQMIIKLIRELDASAQAQREELQRDKGK